MSRALALYRDILRAARALPTPHRRAFVAKAARDRFEKQRAITDPAAIEEAFIYGESSLEQVRAQAAHLSTVLVREEGKFVKPQPRLSTLVSRLGPDRPLRTRSSTAKAGPASGAAPSAPSEPQG